MGNELEVVLVLAMGRELEVVLLLAMGRELEVVLLLAMGSELEVVLLLAMGRELEVVPVLAMRTVLSGGHPAAEQAGTVAMTLLPRYRDKQAVQKEWQCSSALFIAAS